ncbi:hypothetical protein [Streptomyces sp. NPDC002343]
MPIFIRCPRHLWVDGKFGHFGDPRDLAEVPRLDGREPATAPAAVGSGVPREAVVAR